MKTWLEKFLRRLLTLDAGCYMIVLTIHSDGAHWSVQRVGKVEG